MRRAILFLGGVICGALVGAAAGVLLAPQSGAETQEYLRKRLDEIKAEAMEAYEARRKELMEEFERAKKGVRPAVE
ncbi:MAG: YtxH domain-containing protein [Anaerolineae bacterium]